ncbi:unnamed protein product [Thlaspi arvense]|uniref:Uncharacterized protein n=1 Tax=Thlaspi arvense TaxID=13288 RepID=A0AAU9T0T8_THLAR|nr:unnamed protein product [Thlaspi arvense]
MDSRFIHIIPTSRCNSKTEKQKNYGNEERSSMYTFVSALSMSGGDGDNSYSNNSLLQRRVLAKAKPVLVKNTKELMIDLNFPKYIKVADLGCSSGPNTFLAMSEIINIINVFCQKWNQNPPEIDCCLNDLPSNDFNTTFKFIHFFKEKNLTNLESCFVSGVPGSFYSRLFPRKSLHFVHSSYGLHWLSKVPEGLEKNKMSVYITSSSRLSTYKAYSNQFERDFTTFLKLRSEEIVSNGRMVLTFIGRNNMDNPLHRDCCHFWTLLSKSLHDLVIEGLVSASKVDSFYMPFYDPSEKEVKEIIEKEGSFEIKDLETHEYDLGHCNQDEPIKRSKSGQNEANYIRAVSEPLLVAHFGDAIIDILFNKLARHVAQHVDCRNKTTIPTTWIATHGTHAYGRYVIPLYIIMSGGNGDNSYSTNSLLQRRVSSMTKPILVKNTKEMMTNLDFPKCIKVADLGCSSGQNTFLVMSEIANTINVLCQEKNQIPPEIDCCLNDLPGNDFNTTFKFIAFFNDKLTSKIPCFVSGVPGSFYSRLFPRNSLHFIHSNYSIHHLSKVPDGLEENKMSVYITSSSPLSEYKAYFNQFQRDFTSFLEMRSEEMVSNGHMVLTLIGRKTLDDPLYRDCCHWLTLLSSSLRDLVTEGLVSASKVNSFTMPFYDPNEEEVKEIIRNEGSFQINDLETHVFDLGLSNEECSVQSHRARAGEKEASCIRAVTETMLVAHFGVAINIDTLFERYAHHVSQHASCSNKTSITLVESSNPQLGHDRIGCKSDNEKFSGDEEGSSKYTFVSALSMNGGDGDNSYSNNSLLQRRVLSRTKTILVRNTKEMMTDLDFPKCIKVADLGCSSGQNTFLAMSEIVKTINVLCKEWNRNPPEIDCCLNDLPSNDFNTTFKFITSFKKKLTREGSCFVSGVPGSFYSRLFPRKSLHFVHSIYSIHFLSKVPDGLEKNKMSVYITSSSPLSEYMAYTNQFQRDFTTFLRMRSEEMVSNGRMVLTLIGRNTLDDPLYRDCCHFWTLLSNSLRDLVFEGLVSASKVNSFNMPFYDPNEEEVKEIIRNEGSFQINDLETHVFDLGHSNEERSLQSHRVKAGQKEASCIRAVTETMLVAHFGDAIDIDALFEKYAHHVSQHASCRNKTSVTLIVSLIRK